MAALKRHSPRDKEIDTLSRHRLLITLAALALSATSATLAACGGGGGDKSGESPQAVLEDATLEGVQSGEIDLTLGLKASGREGGKIDVTLSGPFQGEDKGSLPQLALEASAKGGYNGDDVDFEGGIVLLPNSAYVNYEGVEYEVDPTTFSFVEQTLKQAQREGGAETGSAGAAACQEEFGKLEVAGFFEDGANEGGADVDGAATTKVSGDLDVSGAIDAVLEVVESQACRTQLAAAGPLPDEGEVESAKDQVGSAVKRAQVDVYVGDDDIVRRLAVQLTIEPQGSGGGPQKVEAEIDLTLSGVNEEQTISAPENARPLSKLFLKLGVDPIELLGLLQGEGGGEGLGELFEGLGVPGVPGSSG